MSRARYSVDVFACFCWLSCTGQVVFHIHCGGRVASPAETGVHGCMSKVPLPPSLPLNDTSFPIDVRAGCGTFISQAQEELTDFAQGPAFVCGL